MQMLVVAFIYLVASAEAFLPRFNPAFVPLNPTTITISHRPVKPTTISGGAAPIPPSDKELEGQNKKDVIGGEENGGDSIIEFHTPEEHSAFLKANPDKIIVVKFFAPWCRACAGLKPKYKTLANGKDYQDLPLVFTEISVAGNKDYIKAMKLEALPTVHVYVGTELVESMACGPSKVPILKQKLADIVAERIDLSTKQLKKKQEEEKDEKDGASAVPLNSTTITINHRPVKTTTIAGGAAPIPPSDKELEGQYKKEISGGEENSGDSIIEFQTEEEHRAFLKANTDKITLVKFFAPWCRGCNYLKPKYKEIAKDYQDLPLAFTEISVSGNRAYMKAMKLVALPTVQIYVGTELVESMPCGRSKVPILKQKLADIVAERIDLSTKQLKKKQEEEKDEKDGASGTLFGGKPVDKAEHSSPLPTLKKIAHLREEIPFFREMKDEEFSAVMQKAKMQTFEPGTVIARQGTKGTTFFVIQEGQVEVLVQTKFEDPFIATPRNGDLGFVTQQLRENRYFGERSLIVGEPRHASFRAIEKTTCFTFEKSDMPSVSVLSGSVNLDKVKVHDDYGVDGAMTPAAEIMHLRPAMEAEKKGIHVQNQDMLLPLLMRWKLIRQVARCFDYIMDTKPVWSDKTESKRRDVLVSRLTAPQRAQFKDVFDIIDTSADGLISLLEMKRAMESVGEEKTEKDLVKMINKGDPSIDGNTVITFRDFMGVMAEAEFYYIFKDTFSSLDTNNSGFISVKDLNHVLCAVRDVCFFSEETTDIFDLYDQDMIVDYEQFSKILLGAI